MLRPLYGLFQHYIFVALCCSAALVESYVLLRQPVDVALVAAGALGTWAIYQTYAQLLAFVGRGGHPANTWRLIKSMVPAGLAAIIAGWLMWPWSLPLWILPIILLAVLLYFLLALSPRWLPPWIQHSGVKTVLLTIIWTVTTAGLPVLQVSDSLTPLVAYLLVDRVLWMFVLCFIFDQRDVLVDAQAGRTSAATVLSRSSGDWLVTTSLLTSLLVHLYGWEVGVAGPIVIGKLIFVVMLTLVYGWHRLRNPSTLYYLAVVDGMMLVSASTVVLGTWINTR